MIIVTSNIKSITNKILGALSISEHSILTDTLEIISKEKKLYFNITDKEYYASISIPITAEEEFHATVNANMFLKLISQITTEDINLTVTDKVLIVEGNGKFKIPLILAFDNLLELPELSIDVVTQSFDIDSNVLSSIANFNAREIAGNAYNDIIRKSYYLDDKGCITFTSGACINNFNLDKPIKVLLGNKIIKLFKLFSDDKVSFELGFSEVGGITQTRIRLQDSAVRLTALTYSNEGLLTKFPVDSIRKRADKIYNYNTSINRNEIAQALNRFIIFSNYDVNNTECTFNFIEDNLIIENKTGDSENIKLSNSINDTYKANLDLFELKAIIDTSKDQMINLSFGDGEAFVITRGNVSNILPECE